MQTVKMAWRNLFRNSRRTLLTALALGVGVMAMALMSDLMDGMFDRMVRVSTASRLGDAQLHAPDYIETRDETLVLKDGEALAKEARAIQGVEAASPRAWGIGLLTIADRSHGVQVLGVDPTREKQVTNWDERRLSGEYFTQDGEVMIGDWLAKKLDVEVGSKLVLNSANIHTGEGSSELVRVAAILQTGDRAMDRGVAIVSLPMAQRMMGLDSSVHEIALDLKGSAFTPEPLRAILAPLDKPGEVVARPWHDLNKSVSSVLALQETYMQGMLFVIFIIIGFGIVNTIAMSLLERMHEFGVMRAIGTSPTRLGGLILSEALLLGAIGAIPGAFVGFAISSALAVNGLDMSTTSAYGMTFVEPIVPFPSLPKALLYALIFTILTALSASASAWRAARVEPIEAMRG